MGIPDGAQSRTGRVLRQAGTGGRAPGEGGFHPSGVDGRSGRGNEPGAPVEIHIATTVDWRLRPTSLSRNQ